MPSCPRYRPMTSARGWRSRGGARSGRDGRLRAGHQEIRGNQRQLVAQFVELVQALTISAPAVEESERPLLARLGHEEVTRLAEFGNRGAKPFVQLLHLGGRRQLYKRRIEAAESVADCRRHLHLALRHRTEPQIFLDRLEGAQELHDLSL